MTARPMRAISALQTLRRRAIITHLSTTQAHNKKKNISQNRQAHSPLIVLDECLDSSAVE